MKTLTKEQTLAELFEAYSILHNLGYITQRDQIQKLITELNA